MLCHRKLNDRLWLNPEVLSPEIDFRSSPNTRHSEAHAGLPVLTHRRHSEAQFKRIPRDKVIVQQRSAILP